MVVYKVLARCDDGEDEIIAYYQTEESADRQVEIMENRSDWRNSYFRFFVIPVEVHP